MRSSWADMRANSAAKNAASRSFANNGGAGTASAPTRAAYVPPHRRNRPATSDPSAPVNSAPSGNDGARYGGSHWSGPKNDYNRSGYGGDDRGGGWGGRSGGWDHGRERAYNRARGGDLTAPPRGGDFPSPPRCHPQ